MAIIIMLIYLAVPIAALVFFLVSLCLYISAKNQERRLPGSVNPQTLQTRKVMLIVSSVIAGVLVAVLIGFMILVMSSIAYM